MFKVKAVRTGAQPRGFIALTRSYKYHIIAFIVICDLVGVAVLLDLVRAKNKPDSATITGSSGAEGFSSDPSIFNARVLIPVKNKNKIGLQSVLRHVVVGKYWPLLLVAVAFLGGVAVFATFSFTNKTVDPSPTPTEAPPQNTSNPDGSKQPVNSTKSYIYYVVAGLSVFFVLLIISGLYRFASVMNSKEGVVPSISEYFVTDTGSLACCLEPTSAAIATIELDVPSTSGPAVSCYTKPAVYLSEPINPAVCPQEPIINVRDFLATHFEDIARNYFPDSGALCVAKTNTAYFYLVAWRLWLQKTAVPGQEEIEKLHVLPYDDLNCSEYHHLLVIGNNHFISKDYFKNGFCFLLKMIPKYSNASLDAFTRFRDYIAFLGTDVKNKLRVDSGIKMVNVEIETILTQDLHNSNITNAGKRQ
jgi:hypothetical protein